MTATLREARPELERPGFKQMLRNHGREIDVLPVPKKARPEAPAVAPRLDFGDMGTDAEEMAYRERMAFPWLADNECGTCGELECDCWRGTLSGDASTEASTFEGSTA